MVHPGLHNFMACLMQAKTEKRAPGHTPGLEGSIRGESWVYLSLA